MISVVIPCYNQARFLGDAIESVLAQTYRDFEIVVVDDGSTDNTAEVAARYAGIHYLRQKNQGVEAARNAGLGESSGEYLVFLDADDRLLPGALETGLENLRARPDCAFVYGNCRYISADGTIMSSHQPPRVESEHYLALLHDCFIWMPGLVMFRRSVFESVAGFDVSLGLRNAEDYELYLRIAREFPIYGHNEIVAEYRQHEANKSASPASMLKAVSIILHSQRKHVKGNSRREKAYKGGLKFNQEYYGEQLIEQMRESRRKGGEYEFFLRNTLTLLRYAPRTLAHHAGRKLRKSIFGQRRLKEKL